MRSRIRQLTLSLWPCQKRKCKMENRTNTMLKPWQILACRNYEKSFTCCRDIKEEGCPVLQSTPPLSMEFLMQLSVVGLFLVLLLYLYLAFTTINFLLWLCTLQVLKDLNPNSAGLFCRNVCQLVSSDGLPHPLRRWHRQTAPILDKYFCKVHDSLWKSSCRLSSSPAQTWWPQRSHANSQWREAIQLWTVQLQVWISQWPQEAQAHQITEFSSFQYVNDSRKTKRR